jgi:preprotein translocase subunit SecA
MAKRDAGPEPDRETWFAEQRLRASVEAKEGGAPVRVPTEADWQAAYRAWDEAYKAALQKHRAECDAEHEEVVKVGGLHVLGTERHESRRIDNQLRGRSGRQGDPGSSKFFLSLEDDLMRIFASDRIASLMETFGVQDNEPIEHPWLTKSIESAQKRVEGQHFDSRKHLLEYDDVMNQQRKTIYALRKEVLASGSGLPLVEFREDPKTKKKIRSERSVSWDDQKERVLDLIEDMIIEMVETCLPHKRSDEWDPERLRIMVKEQFDVDMGFGGAGAEREKLEMDIFNVVEKKYLKRWEGYVPFRRNDGSTRAVPFRDFQKWVYLETIDTLWKDHLLAMDHLRQGIGLRGYGQKDPKQEYKKEGYELFTLMMGRIGASVVSSLLKVEAMEAPAEKAAPSEQVLQHKQQRVTEHRGGDGEGKPKTVERAGPRVGRNDPCYCGSGKKYKKCHLPLDEAAGINA